MADVTDIERLNYYEGEYLGAVDFEAEQEYHRDMRRRHNIGPHTWGIVTGLDIAQFLNGGANNEVDILIQPGVAVDGFGREIVVFSPFQLTAEMFSDFPAKQTLTVWIGYTQQMINPDSDSCASAGQTNAYSRVQENFQIVIQPFPPTSDPVYVGGNVVTPPSTSPWTQPATLPALPTIEGAVVIALDDSVPFQELPDDNTTANWLVPLGQVLWDGKNQVFVQSADGTANQNRQYVGSVASTIYAPAGTLTIQDRSTPASAVSGGASTGSATVTGFSASAGVVTLTVFPALATAYTTGQVVVFSGFSSGLAGLNGRGFSILGTPAPGTTSFAISLSSVTGAGSDSGTATPQPPGVAVEIQGSLTVDGNEQIPQGSLSFGTQQAQLINLSGINYGIGVQTNTLYFRSASDFAWYVNGQYSASQDAPGSGGSLSMLLDSSGDLTLNGALVIDNANKNSGKVNPGLTFGNTGSEGIASNRSSSGANQKGLDFYTSSDVRLSITSTGNVGIGTTSPGSALDVSGNIATNSVFGFSNVQQFASPYGVYISAPASETMGLFTSGNQQVTITSTGEVGIGTMSPGSSLDVRGNIATNSVFGFSSVQQATSPYGVYIAAPASQTMGLFTNSNQQLTINSSGNVGIGTTSPGSALDVRGNIATNSVFGFSSVQQASSPYGVCITAPASQTMGLFTNFNQQVTISSSGNVGIGNINPQASLQIGTFGPFIFPGGGGSATNWASSAVGFNMYRGSDNNWHTINDSANGGGCVIYGNTGGDLFVAQVPSVGPAAQSISDGSLYPSHIVFSISAGSPARATIHGNLTVSGSKSGYVVDRFLSRTKKHLDQGDVVVLHAKPSAVFYGVQNRIPLVEVALATKACDTRVCGIVDEPILSDDAIPDLDQKSLGKGTVGLMVTLGAYAYCKVDADISPIAAGDLLTTSNTPGHAQHFDPQIGSAVGCIIGKALASLEKGKGKIPILISHQ
jgi:hypothetical protein